MYKTARWNNLFLSDQINILLQMDQFNLTCWSENVPLYKFETRWSNWKREGKTCVSQIIKEACAREY